MEARDGQDEGEFTELREPGTLVEAEKGVCYYLRAKPTARC